MDLRGIAYTACTTWLKGLKFCKVYRSELSAGSVASNSIPLGQDVGKEQGIDTVIVNHQ